MSITSSGRKSNTLKSGMQTPSAPGQFKSSYTRLLGFMFADLRGSLSLRSIWVFCACLFLGIALIAVCAGMLNLFRGGLENQQRYLFGGDAQISDRKAVTDEQLAWLKDSADVSLLIELRTMMGTKEGKFTVVELQSVDDSYPLYGKIEFSDQISLSDAIDQSTDGSWGVALDPILADQLNVQTGDTVLIGDLEVQVRAFILSQPDRSLRADVRGPPVMIAEPALQLSGLLLPTSLVDYDYRIRIAGDVLAWRESLRARFPQADWEVQTLNERSEFVTERLNQVASVLLLIGCCTVLIGGLGVANSIGAYLQTKYRALATLQSLGARSSQLIFVYFGQVIFLGFVASVLGSISGTLIALAGAAALADALPVSAEVNQLFVPFVLAVFFGVITALLFSLPALGRTLELRPALLIKGATSIQGPLPMVYRIAVFFSLMALVVVLFQLVPEFNIGLYFVAGILLLLIILEGLVRLVSRLSARVATHPWFEGRFAWRMAVAGLHRPGTALRPMLISLGAALTLLVACTLVIAATVNTLNSTIPESAPALAFYDIQDDQLNEFTELVKQLPGYQQVFTTPLVLGRLRAVNAEELSVSSNTRRALEANDEHKLSYRSAGIDNTSLVHGQWWPDNYTGDVLFAMEDREADQLGLAVGDRLRFDILGESLDAELVAIYEQARLETRFWLEGVFTDGALDRFITRHIGTAYLDEGADINALNEIGAVFPNVVTVRTAKALQSARDILGNAGKALALIAVVSLLASILVMASVVAVNRTRQVYEASIMYALGSRMSDVIKSIVFEYALLGLLLIAFSTVVGSIIGGLIVTYWIELSVTGVWYMGLLVASGASFLCLAAGAFWMTNTLKASPSSLLKRASG